MQHFSLMVEKTPRIVVVFQRVSHVRKTHEPQRVLEVWLRANAECNPAGIRNPMVLLCEALRQESIANCLWKGNIDDTARVQMPHLRFPIPEFSAAKPMWMHRDVRPSQDLL